MFSVRRFIFALVWSVLSLLGIAHFTVGAGSESYGLLGMVGLAIILIMAFLTSMEGVRQSEWSFMELVDDFLRPPRQLSDIGYGVIGSFIIVFSLAALFGK